MKSIPKQIISMHIRCPDQTITANIPTYGNIFLSQSHTLIDIATYLFFPLFSVLLKILVYSAKQFLFDYKTTEHILAPKMSRKLCLETSVSFAYFIPSVSISTFLHTCSSFHSFSFILCVLLTPQFQPL